MNLTHILIVLCISIIYAKVSVSIPTMPLENSHPSYEWHYSVHDSLTGDVKDQFEHRRGDYVVGRYSLVDPDGYRRIVEYSSEPFIGFTAQVRREPLYIHRMK